LLWLNGSDHRNLPLLERKRRLREIVPAPPSPFLYVDHVVGTGVDLFDAVCRKRPGGHGRQAERRAVRAGRADAGEVKNRNYGQIRRQTGVVQEAATDAMMIPKGLPHTPNLWCEF
jgi:hypothetical protein